MESPHRTTERIEHRERGSIPHAEPISSAAALAVALIVDMLGALAWLCMVAAIGTTVYVLAGLAWLIVGGG